MKAYMLSVLIIDHDEIGLDSAIEELENGRFGNRCIAPGVVGSREADIGEWHDDHPLNFLDETRDAEIARLFP